MEDLKTRGICRINFRSYLNLMIRVVYAHCQQKTEGLHHSLPIAHRGHGQVEQPGCRVQKGEQELYVQRPQYQQPPHQTWHQTHGQEIQVSLHQQQGQVMMFKHIQIGVTIPTKAFIAVNRHVKHNLVIARIVFLQQAAQVFWPRSADIVVTQKSPLVAARGTISQPSEKRRPLSGLTAHPTQPISHSQHNSARTVLCSNLQVFMGISSLSC